jgi:hypothetical protein
VQPRRLRVVRMAAEASVAADGASRLAQLVERHEAPWLERARTLRLALVDAVAVRALLPGAQQSFERAAVRGQLLGMAAFAELALCGGGELGRMRDLSWILRIRMRKGGPMAALAGIARLRQRRLAARHVRVHARQDQLGLAVMAVGADLHAAVEVAFALERRRVLEQRRGEGREQEEARQEQSKRDIAQGANSSARGDSEPRS